jgi:hypothetical protein
VARFIVEFFVAACFRYGADPDLNAATASGDLFIGTPGSVQTKRLIEVSVRLRKGSAVYCSRCQDDALASVVRLQVQVSGLVNPLPSGRTYRRTHAIQ